MSPINITFHTHRPHRPLGPGQLLPSHAHAMHRAHPYAQPGPGGPSGSSSSTPAQKPKAASSSSHARRQTSHAPVWISVAHSSSSKTPGTAALTDTIPSGVAAHVQPTEPAPADASSSSSTSGSSTPLPSNPSARRKSLARRSIPANAPTVSSSTSTNGGGDGEVDMTSTAPANADADAESDSVVHAALFARIAPLNDNIVSRCLAPVLTHITSATPKKQLALVSRSKSSSFFSAHTHARVHPYSRAADLGNDRSANPSPRERARAARAEADKAQAKKDSAAAARAAIAAKRKNKAKGRAGSRVKDATVADAGSGSGAEGGGSAAATRSPSPLVGGGEEAGKEGKVPIITTEAASSNGSPVLGQGSGISGHPALAPSRGLKRTRSNGLINISTSTANSLGSGPGIGSPLRSVTGPTDVSSSVPAPNTARRSSHSPQGTASALPAVSSTSGGGANTAPIPQSEQIPAHPKSFPLAAGRLAPRASSAALERAASASPAAAALALGAAGVAGAATGAGMRRTASATTGGRRGSQGSDASATTAGTSATGGMQRSRRETVLPRNLRDYDMRATPV